MSSLTSSIGTITTGVYSIIFNVEMAVNLQIRNFESAEATEIYISAVPSGNAPLQTQGEEVFSSIRDILLDQGAVILQERIFAVNGAMEPLCDLRRRIYGDIDDGVAASMLIGKKGSTGQFSGVQVHAIVSDKRPQVLNVQGQNCGRLISLPALTYFTLSGISARQVPTAAKQARAMLEKAESAIKANGGDMFSVPRTWLWLNDMLSWYDSLNNIRNKFYSERGLLKKNGEYFLPASTGIGLAPSNGAMCAMDLVAVLEPKNSIQYVQTTGKQKSAFEYGSAFSRATIAPSPAGQTVFVSGTASIDDTGATTNIGDAEAQIKDTIENVQAVLTDTNCGDEDVVQAMAYCKTPEVEKIFNSFKSSVDWPWITMICDVCRDDLLFETEAAAKVKS